MAFMNGLDVMLSAAELTNLIGKLLYKLYIAIANTGAEGAFGWTVVAFTLILKIVMLPLDFWQKNSTRKNNLIMKRMKPQLDDLQAACGNDKQLYQQKQMELYKKEGYSMFGACLPTVVTLVLFMVVFSGFNATVRYHNELVTEGMIETYTEYVQKNEDGSYARDEYGLVIVTDKEAARTAASQYYLDHMEGWLWVKNVFMPDTWSDVVVTEEKYTGTGLGKLGITELPDDIGIVGSYSRLIQSAEDSMNKDGFWDFKRWNGYMILPLLSTLLSVMSTLLMKGQQPEMPQSGDKQSAQAQQMNMKFMQYSMPVMIGVFSLFYSSAFSIYMFFSSLFSVVFNVVYNKVTSKIDAEREQAEMQAKFKR